MKATLPTNYQDDILNVSTEGKRKYRMIYNDDGTVSFVDVTPYDQEGSDFGAGDINVINQAINESFDKNKMLKTTDELEAVTQEGYGVDALLVKSVNESLKTYYDEDTETLYIHGGTSNYTYDSSTEILYIG